MILYQLLTRYLLDPLSWVLYLVIAALIVEHYGLKRWQRGFTAGALILLLALIILPIGEWLSRPLENAYPRPPLPGHVDGIVVLDAGLNSSVFMSRGVMGENNSAVRVMAGADLARRFPQAKFVYSGTSGLNPAQQQSEHDAVESLLAILGVAPGRTLFERTSRDTGENLRNSMALVHPKNGQTWMLVTAALQMPRAMAIARKLGWTMVPWPSDYVSTLQPQRGFKLAHPSDGLRDIDRAVHEWFGLAYYRLGGRAE